MSELGREEFLLHMELVRADIKGVHDRLDALNGRTREVERDVEVLKDRSDDAKTEARQAGTSAGRMWGAGGAIVGGAVWVLWELYTR